MFIGGEKVKLKAIGILLVLVIAVAMVSGCTGGSTPAPTTTPTDSGVTPTPVAATTTPGDSSAGTNVIGSLFNPGKFNWFEYKISSVNDGESTSMNIKYEYDSTTYKGVAAEHTTMHMKTSEDMTMLIDMYTSKADSRTLGGHYKMMMGGEVIMEQDIPEDQLSQYSQQDFASKYDDEETENYNFASAGVEVITVPAGVFTCNKYTVTGSDAHETFWVDTSVPVPVKFTSGTSDSEMVMELVDWG